MRSLPRGRFPNVVREAKPRLVRVSQLIPQARSLGLSIFSPSCTGDDGSVNDASERHPTRPEEFESLLIGDKGSSEKGTTPESGGGIRNLAGTAA
jgi:hypothetical protein